MNRCLHSYYQEKNHLQDGRKVVTSMWSFYNCFNISICNQTNHLGSAVNFNSCGNTKHVVMVKINFGIS